MAVAGLVSTGVNLATQYGNRNAGGENQSQYMNNSIFNPMMIGSRNISTKTRLKGIGSNLGGNLFNAETGKFQGGMVGKMFGAGGGDDGGGFDPWWQREL